MAVGSTIEWTEATWNPVTGCTKVSFGCRNCYAERMAHRLKAMGLAKYRNGFRVTTHEDVLAEPLKWKQPRLIFVNSMSDLFHEDVPASFIERVFEVMGLARQHTFQVLTKRPERAAAMSDRLPWTANVWLGVSIESSRWLPRLSSLKEAGAYVKFLSLEPLLGPLPDLTLQEIDWVIVGGESGPGARPMREDWVKEIRDKCINDQVPFFFKQWGGVFKKRAGRTLEGRTWDQMPHIPEHAGPVAAGLPGSQPHRSFS